MRRFAPLVLVLIGCARDGDKGPTPAGPPAGGDEAVTLAPLEVKGWGSLTGRVTFDGQPPAVKDLDIGTHPHKDYCCKPGLKDETWVVDPETKGVANVV